MKRVCFWVLLSLTSISTPAQNVNSFTPNLIPPSPNAASLGKYADWPVNLYTGTPAISIPIYSLQARGLTIPVSLNYHASGIKVGDVASWVGLGWSLDAGGVITRSVRGLPDEIDPQGYLYVRKNFPVPGDLSVVPSNFDTLYVMGANLGAYDLESDMYMFNALGRSFKFYINSNDSIITQSINDIRIHWNYQDGNILGHSAFEADLDDGTKLYFGGTPGTDPVEITTLQSNLNSYVSAANRFISAWYLTKIITNKGEEIDLTYSGSTILQNSHISETDYLPQAAYIPPKSPTINSGTQSILQFSVATIESPLAKISFIRDTVQRSDLTGDYALRNIQVYSKLTHTTIQDTRLQYTYSQCSGSNPPNYYPYYILTDTGSYRQRLKLMSIQDYLPNTSTKIREWDLAYNPLNLPSRRSTAQDHWGYFNGAMSNVTLLPYFIGFNAPTYMGGNREPDSSYVQAEMLDEITYPTGGHSIFTYEANSYDTTEQVFQDTTVAFSYDLDYPLLETTLSKTFSFTIIQTQQITMSLHGLYSTMYKGNHVQGNTMPTATLAGTDNSASYQLTLDSSGNASLNETLLPGTYQFILRRDTSHAYFQNDPNHSSVSATLVYGAYKGIQAVNQLVGGVRIKAIDEYDPVASTNNHRSFVYEQPLVVIPYDVNTGYTRVVDYFTGPPLNTDYYYEARNSSTKYSLGTLQGGIIGYGKVTTIFGANGENGNTVSFFANNNDEGVIASRSFPYPPVTSLEWRRGLLLSQVTKGSDGAIKTKLDNEFWFEEKDHITVCKTGITTYYPNDGNYHQNAIVTYFYDLIGEEVRNISTTETAYSSNSHDSVVKITNQYWDNDNYARPNRIEHFDSKGNKRSMILHYPKDYLPAGSNTTGNTVLDTLIARNQFVSVESRDSLVYPGGSSYIDQGQLSSYKIIPAGLVQPDRQYTLSLANLLASFSPYNSASNAFDPHYTQEISFDSYDSVGNIAQYTGKSTPPVSLIWDYKYNYPIAEVRNAAIADVAYTSFEADGTGSWAIASPVRDTTTGITGTKSYNLASGSVSRSGLTSSNSYVVSYWTTNTMAYNISGTQTGYPIQGKTILINGVNWTYFEHQITGQTGVSFSGTGRIDELRLYPATAQMTTHTYAPLMGISSSCDVGNRVTYYTYDPIGRLRYIKDQDGNIIKTIEYHYQGEQ